MASSRPTSFFSLRIVIEARTPSADRRSCSERSPPLGRRCIGRPLIESDVRRKEPSAFWLTLARIAAASIRGAMPVAAFASASRSAASSLTVSRNRCRSSSFSSLSFSSSCRRLTSSIRIIASVLPYHT